MLRVGLKLGCLQVGTLHYCATHAKIKKKKKRKGGWEGRKGTETLILILLASVTSDKFFGSLGSCYAMYGSANSNICTIWELVRPTESQSAC